MTEKTKNAKGADEAPQAATLDTEALRVAINPAASDPAQAEAVAKAQALVPDVAPVRRVGIPGWESCTDWAELVYRGGLPARKPHGGYGSVMNPLDGDGTNPSVPYAFGNVMRNIEWEGKIVHLTDADGTMHLGQGKPVRLPILLAFHLAISISASPNKTVGPSYTDEKSGRLVNPSQCLDIRIAPELLPKALAACAARYGQIQGSLWTKALRHLTIRSIDDNSILHQGEGVSLNAAGIATTAEVESLRAQLTQMQEAFAGLAQQQAK